MWCCIQTTLPDYSQTPHSQWSLAYQSHMLSSGWCFSQKLPIQSHYQQRTFSYWPSHTNSGCCRHITLHVSHKQSYLQPMQALWLHRPRSVPPLCDFVERANSPFLMEAFMCLCSPLSYDCILINPAVYSSSEWNSVLTVTIRHLQGCKIDVTAWWRTDFHVSHVNE